MVRCTASRIVRVVPATKEGDMTTTNTRQDSIAAVCEALGVPQKDWHLFSRWAAAPLTPTALDALYSYVDVMIADRCRRSTDDLLAKLIELEVDGEELTVDAIRRVVADRVAGAS